ncbi:Kunitz/Bovine pancreatic trypsin inhibitor domain protein [Oesophagostomum dentatum]|uniref:Kunitz/Bovine pancreatic trypsin inhibitor domain protein n=1 Tax=Oesophagostomum dentatum TaxID=61180 RepID=A0A0B1S0E7_OESDE|nr:Kunitz/Bovine pancreatic trypsin inhibitor domain protein [Oesophagostomum dentatum]
MTCLTLYFCSKPLVQGPCLASLRRFGYDPTTKKCVKFTYGGCDGNENNFATRAECRETCKDYSTYDPRDVCKLPAERGPCMDNIPRCARFPLIHISMKMNTWIFLNFVLFSKTK